MRKILALIALILGPLPALAQAPPAVGALPDTERRTSFALTASTCACSVGFQLYGDSTDVDQWIEVWIDGTRYLSNHATKGWALTSATGPLATIPRPITNAVLTFTTAQTGTLQIVGARRPRRTSQFAENRGVAARDLNLALTDIVAQNRETWDRINDVTGRVLQAPPGETLAPLGTATARGNSGAGTVLGFNAAGQPTLLAQTAASGIGLNIIQDSLTSAKIWHSAASPNKLEMGAASVGTFPYAPVEPGALINFTPFTIGAQGHNQFEVRATNSRFVASSIGGTVNPRLIVSDITSFGTEVLGNNNQAGGGFTGNAVGGSVLGVAGPQVGGITFNFVNLGVTGLSTDRAILNDANAPRGSMSLNVMGLTNSPAGGVQNALMFWTAKGALWNGTLASPGAGTRLGEIGGFIYTNNGWAQTEAWDIGGYAEQAATSSTNPPLDATVRQPANIIVRLWKDLESATAYRVVSGWDGKGGNFFIGEVATNGNGTNSTKSMLLENTSANTGSKTGWGILNSQLGLPYWRVPGTGADQQIALLDTSQVWSANQQYNAGVLVGSATGGFQGAGTLNATGLFVNGAAVTAISGAYAAGGVAYSTASALVISAVGANVNLVLHSGVAGAPTWGKVVSLDLNITTSSCSANQYVNAISAAAAGTCAAVTVVNGVTYPASGTSGGIPYFSSTSTVASSALLTANAIVLGGGAGVTPATGTLQNPGTGLLSTVGNNDFYLSTRGNTATNPGIRISDAATPDNYLYIFNGVSGTLQIFPDGSATNIAVNYNTKGTGALQFLTAGAGAMSFKTRGGNCTGNPCQQFGVTDTDLATRYITVTGAIAGGNPTLTTTGGSLNMPVALLASAGTASTTTGTGSIIVTGGVGISGNVFAGGTGNFAGILNATSGTASTTTTTGAAVITGGIGISGAAYHGAEVSTATYVGVGTKIRANGTAPALTSCGTSPAITGSDLAGEVTMGTGTPTGCVITFNVAYASAPYCTITSQSNPATITPAYSVSTTAITYTQAATSSNKINYECFGRSGGWLLKRDLNHDNDNTPVGLNAAA